MKPEAPEDPEAVWLRDVYKPNEINLTVRAVIAGMVIGCVMCVSNVYVFFKTGWSMGVTITACILAFAVFKVLGSVAKIRPLGMLENNALTTVASGAGYMTGGGNMAAFGALLMVTSVRPPQVPMVLWFAAIAALGVFAAIPIKRQLVNKEALAFPTGTATAETLRSIHGQQPVSATEEPIPTAQEAAAYRAGRSKASEDLAMKPARALAWAAGFGAVVTVLRDIAKVVPGQIALPFSISGHTLAQWTLAFKTEVILLGAGALMSFRTGWSVLLGGLLTYGVMAPALLEQGLISGVGYKAIVEWTVWPGAAILVGAGLTSFALDYKSLGRAFTGIAQIFRGRRTDAEQGIAAVEAPEWWFPAGFMVLTPVVVFLMSYLFQIPVWAAIIAVPLAVIMGFIAARVTGETDVTPTKALGPVTQMMYGVLTPGNLSGNIMSANVTGGVGLHAADLLTTLKTGWLLGAKPRHQLYAQLFGVLAGAFIIVPAFNVIIPDPAMLGTDEWPAPSALIWAGVSNAFAGGIENLGSEARTAIFVGLALGVVLALAEKFAPPKLRTYVPSPYGLGIALVVPGSNCIAMFIGAALAELFRRRQQGSIVVPVASGLIAGESLMGVAVSIMVAVRVL